MLKRTRRNENEIWTSHRCGWVKPVTNYKPQVLENIDAREGMYSASFAGINYSDRLGFFDPTLRSGDILEGGKRRVESDKSILIGC